MKLKSISFFLLTAFLSSIIFGQADPNADPNWDWRNGDDQNQPYPASVYTMYKENGDGTITGVYRSAPWNQWNSWDGLDDNRKEDGWVLLCRDFGTPFRAVLGGEGITDRPYFMIYNKYSSVLRVFILVNANDDYTTGGITVKFVSYNKTATLTNLKGRAYAADKIDIVGQYSGTGLTTYVGDEMWVWAEYPLAYDPNMIKSSDHTASRLEFQVVGTQEAELEVEGELVGVTGVDKLVRKFMTQENNGSVTASSLVEETPGNTFSFSGLKTYVSSRAKDWESWKKFIDNSYNRLPQYEEGGNFEGSANNFKHLVGELKNGWIVENLPVIGQISGLFTYVLGGGKSSTNKGKTAPMFIGEKIKLNGSITTEYKLPSGAALPIPGSRVDPSSPTLGSNVPLLYNIQGGLLNLKSSPVLQYKTYMQEVTPVRRI